MPDKDIVTNSAFYFFVRIDIAYLIAIISSQFCVRYSNSSFSLYFSFLIIHDAGFFSCDLLTCFYSDSRFKDIFFFFLLYPGSANSFWTTLFVDSLGNLWIIIKEKKCCFISKGSCPEWQFLLTVVLLSLGSSCCYWVSPRLRPSLRMTRTLAPFRTTPSPSSLPVMDRSTLMA